MNTVVPQYLIFKCVAEWQYAALSYGFKIVKTDYRGQGNEPIYSAQNIDGCCFGVFCVRSNKGFIERIL